MQRHGNAIVCCIKTLGIDAIVGTVLVKGCPAHHIAAVNEPSNAGAFLIAQRGGIDAYFAAHCNTAGVVVLGVDAIAAAVLVKGRPAHHIAAVSEPGDAGGALIA